MEWVETTAKSVAEAQDRALDQLGVAADEAEFEIIEEPKSGLFGRTRGEARVRARVKPAEVRPKQDRRSRSKGRSRRDGNKSGGEPKPGREGSSSKSAATTSPDGSSNNSNNSNKTKNSQGSKQRSKAPQTKKEKQPMSEDRPESTVTPQEVGDAAVAFMTQLSAAFGVADATTELSVDGTDLEVRVSGTDVGLMVGPGGRTLTAVQDLARVASQRRLGDHDTRLRIDVGGYREKRRAALEEFAGKVAEQVIATGSSKALEPMQSADRKAVHDAVIEIEGVASHSEGDDPARRVVITPA